METYNNIRKIECRIYDKSGLWTMTSTSTLKKGITWDIPKNKVKMKKFIIDKFKKDLNPLKKGGFLAFSFGHSGGSSGIMLTPQDLNNETK